MSAPSANAGELISTLATDMTDPSARPRTQGLCWSVRRISSGHSLAPYEYMALPAERVHPAPSRQTTAPPDERPAKPRTDERPESTSRTSTQLGAALSSPKDRRTLLDFFDDHYTSSAEFLIHDTGYRSWTHSYAEVRGAALRFAGRLREQRIAKGDKVIVWGENRAEWVVAFWGCVMEGVIVVPIDYRASGVVH